MPPPIPKSNGVSRSEGKKEKKKKLKPDRNDHERGTRAKRRRSDHHPRKRRIPFRSPRVLGRRLHHLGLRECTGRLEGDGPVVIFGSLGKVAAIAACVAFDIILQYAIARGMVDFVTCESMHGYATTLGWQTHVELGQDSNA